MSSNIHEKGGDFVSVVHLVKMDIQLFIFRADCGCRFGAANFGFGRAFNQLAFELDASVWFKEGGEIGEVLSQRACTLRDRRLPVFALTLGHGLKLGRIFRQSVLGAREKR